MPRLQQPKWLILAASLCLFFSFLAALSVGSMSLSLWQSGQGLATLLTPWQFGDLSNMQLMVLQNLRLPRALLAVFVGANLALCGALLQGLLRNPLADPSIIGVSGGAAFGAAIAMFLAGIVVPQLTPLWQEYWVASFAFTGGCLATFAVYRIGTGANGTSVVVMLLAGVAIAALAAAGIAILTYLADDALLRNITFWQLGSIAGANWQMVLLSGFASLLLLLSVPYSAKALNAILLGESEARHLGVNVQQVKTRLIIITALAVGIAVATSGMIGFIGLVIPHLIRLWLGADHRYLLPLSALLGACLLLLADVAARVVIAPAELPVGVITGLIGAPFFIFLLLKQRRFMV
ncbi:FecCD family ABC transporter permease [Motilimonas pumila]|uniref:Iron ABC transporter permease n=1 Tax=Motilimonas pumila TaxID=2303987 RepID=A0A418YKK0_9GAMM|nr:iron ABC transporter permease [Motilimonas pumila]RJG51505.1 iron ABC transporter permease [Motilimonas pumila]